jgi:hypothetical protein
MSALKLLSDSIASELRAAQSRVRVYQLAALGTLDSALVILEVAPGSARERLKADSESVKRNAASELEQMRRVAQEIAVKALEISPGVEIAVAQGFSGEMGRHIGQAIVNQVGDNANQVDLVFSKIRILAGEFESQGMPKDRAIQKGRETAMKSFRFRFIDALGRIRRVDDRVTTLVNGSLYQMVNELMVMGMVQRGIKKARVYRPGHPTHGKEFEISADLAGFLALKEEIFHPRSLALVEAIVPQSD